jgi:hypothetical protein
MDNKGTSLTDRIRGWFERSPKAQRAYERLSADLDTVVERVDSATSGLRERVGPIIDPPRQPAPGPAPESIPDQATEPGLTRDEQVAMEAEQPTSDTGRGRAQPGPAPASDGEPAR